MKTSLPPLAALLALPLGALLTLAACGGPETISANEHDPQAEALNAAAPVSNLRMIQASRTFRCKDNSLIYVDFYTDNTAAARTDKAGPATTLTAAEGKPPFTAEGWSVSENAALVTISAPGKPSQSCKA